MPGKGHPKSKKGCINCKARRVKCSEEHPNCRACRRLGLECRYPVPQPPAPSAPSTALRTTPAALTLEDLRFFHHFLIESHPSLPFGEDRVWRDVAAMSHEYNFLAHAIMGFAAQSLTVSTSLDHSARALHHRVRAIAAMNEALSSPSMTPVDGDARLAAAIVLTFQSANMEDGMMDFLRMLRGWMIIQTTVIPSMTRSLFQGFTEEAFVNSMRGFVAQNKSNPQPDVSAGQDLQQALDDFNASLRLLGVLCRSPSELRYLVALQRVAQAARTDLAHACLELVPLYAMANDMDAAEFAHFTDEANFTAQILLTHFWMLSWLLGSFGSASGFAMPESTVLRWVQRAAEQLPNSHRRHVLWPLGMVETQGLGRAHSCTMQGNAHFSR